MTALTLFFKRFFMVAAILVLFIAAEFSDKLSEGASAEYYWVDRVRAGGDAVRLGGE